MTEAEWLSCRSADDMAGLLTRRRKNRLSDRKFRLLMCAVCRAIWEQMIDNARRAVDAVEEFADNPATENEVRAADRAIINGPITSLATSAARWSTWGAWRGCDSLNIAVKCCVEFTGKFASEDVLAPRVRCVAGNPFRPVAFDPAWRTSDVVALARGAYDDRAFDRMPILADALQDAGCDNDDVLNHCRDTNTPHARGCWVVDLVLGKV